MPTTASRPARSRAFTHASAMPPGSCRGDRRQDALRDGHDGLFRDAGVGLSGFLHSTPKLIWSDSGSVPIGLYAAWPAGVVHVIELVVIRPPEPLASLLGHRRYLPKGVRLLKPSFRAIHSSLAGRRAARRLLRSRAVACVGIVSLVTLDTHPAVAQAASRTGPRRARDRRSSSRGPRSNSARQPRGSAR